MRRLWLLSVSLPPGRAHGVGGGVGRGARRLRVALGRRVRGPPGRLALETGWVDDGTHDAGREARDQGTLAEALLHRAGRADARHRHRGEHGHLQRGRQRAAGPAPVSGERPALHGEPHGPGSRRAHPPLLRGDVPDVRRGAGQPGRHGRLPDGQREPGARIRARAAVFRPGHAALLRRARGSSGARAHVRGRRGRGRRRSRCSATRSGGRRSGETRPWSAARWRWTGS